MPDTKAISNIDYFGMHFWARGYLVSTVGANEDTVRAYIQGQEKEDSRLEQLEMFKRQIAPLVIR